jgi:hypothetical protein
MTNVFLPYHCSSYFQVLIWSLYMKTSFNSPMLIILKRNRQPPLQELLLVVTAPPLDARRRLGMRTQ